MAMHDHRAEKHADEVSKFINAKEKEFKMGEDKIRGAVEKFNEKYQEKSFEKKFEPKEP